MRVAVAEAEGQLTELVRRAEAGEEIILTREGQAAVRLAPVRASQTPAERRRIIDAVRKSAAAKAAPGVSAARSQDFLYDDDGLPG